LKVEAEKQQEASLPKEGQKGFQCSGNFPPHKTRDVIGSFVGKSGKTVEKIKVRSKKSSHVRRFHTPRGVVSYSLRQ
jgi:hypothetical protein